MTQLFFIYFFVQMRLERERQRLERERIEAEREELRKAQARYVARDNLHVYRIQMPSRINLLGYPLLNLPK